MTVRIPPPIFSGVDILEMVFSESRIFERMVYAIVNTVARIVIAITTSISVNPRGPRLAVCRPGNPDRTLGSGAAVTLEFTISEATESLTEVFHEPTEIAETSHSVAAVAAVERGVIEVAIFA